MKIAFVSYEYPPDTSFGGIATYVHQIAKLLSERGHHVEVFSASLHREGSWDENGVLVHRVFVEDRKERLSFSELVYDIFLTRHLHINFDIVESAESGAHARKIVEQSNDLPLVVKLHTPTYMITELGYVPPTLSQKLRWYLGAVRRLKLPKTFPKYNYDDIDKLERKLALEADIITTPSADLGAKVSKRWGLREDEIHCVPNPYVPASDLLNIPFETQKRRILFVGRLEVRKGILDLAKAIPTVLSRHSDVKFRFVGAIGPSPEHGLDMQLYLLKKLKRFRSSLEFEGSVSLDEIPKFLAEADICVFPSRWENFPNVCLEAMAAGRGIVASNAGGMADMLAAGSAGCLIPPRDPAAIASAVCALIENPSLRAKLGQAARDRVLTEYNSARVGMLQEAIYESAVAKRRTMNIKKQNI